LAVPGEAADLDPQNVDHQHRRVIAEAQRNAERRLPFALRSISWPEGTTGDDARLVALAGSLTPPHSFEQFVFGPVVRVDLYGDEPSGELLEKTITEVARRTKRRPS
jgi:hypothetical protein